MELLVDGDGVRRVRVEALLHEPHDAGARTPQAVVVLWPTNAQALAASKHVRQSRAGSAVGRARRGEFSALTVFVSLVVKTRS